MIQRLTRAEIRRQRQHDAHLRHPHGRDIVADPETLARHDQTVRGPPSRDGCAATPTPDERPGERQGSTTSRPTTRSGGIDHTTGSACVQAHRQETRSTFCGTKPGKFELPAVGATDLPELGPNPRQCRTPVRIAPIWVRACDASRTGLSPADDNDPERRSTHRAAETRAGRPRSLQWGGAEGGVESVAPDHDAGVAGEVGSGWDQVVGTADVAFQSAEVDVLVVELLSGPSGGLVDRYTNRSGPFEVSRS